MDTAQWPQGIGVVKTSMDDKTSSRHVVVVTGDQRKATRPQKDQALNCPRCNSTNTKFCYYNNYSLSQPRYFCKTCRRYWTAGGSLRNVPVGGGSRKNKRFSTSSSSSTITSSSALTIPTTATTSFSNSASQNPKIHHGQDLNLAYPSSTDHHHHHHQDYNSTNLSKFIELPPPPNNNPSSTTSNSSHFSSMELLKSDHHHNIITSRGLSSSSSFIPMSVSDNSNTIYSSTSGFPMQEYKPTLNFSLDGYENNGYGSSSLHQEVVQHNGSGGGSSNGARLLFPFEELKQVSTTSEFDHHHRSSAGNNNGDSTGYWNGMLSGGSW